MEIHNKNQPEQRVSPSSYSRPGSVSASVLVAIALAGFFFWVAAEIRWSQTSNSPKSDRHRVDSPSVISLPGNVNAAPVISTSANGPVTSQSVVVTFEPGDQAAQTRRPVYSYNYGAYNQLVKTCSYWTEKARTGESVLSLQQASCKRMRDYARNAGYGSPGAASIQQPVRRSTQQVTNTIVRADSNERLVRRCTYVDERIDWINSRLRAGYRVAEGERWKQELRDLKTENYDKCRNLPK